MAEDSAVPEGAPRRNYYPFDSLREGFPAPSPGAFASPRRGESEPIQEQLAAAWRERELARLELNWEIERRAYLINARRSPPGQVPTRGAAIGLLVAGGVFATLWLVPALFTWVFLLVSMPLGLLGVVVLLEGSRQFRLAGLYLRAFEAFEAKKQAIRRESVCLAAAPHDIAAEPLVAKTALWEVDQEIDQLRRDAALARLDKEWEIELLKHYITPRRGKPYLPVKTQAAWILAGGILLGVFVAFVGTPRPRPLLGCIFGTIGIVGGIFMYAEADGYEQAYAKYQSRRKKIIEGP